MTSGPAGCSPSSNSLLSDDERRNCDPAQGLKRRSGDGQIRVNAFNPGCGLGHAAGNPPLGPGRLQIRSRFPLPHRFRPTSRRYGWLHGTLPDGYATQRNVSIWLGTRTLWLGPTWSSSRDQEAPQCFVIGSPGRHVNLSSSGNGTTRRSGNGLTTSQNGISWSVPYRLAQRNGWIRGL